MQGRTKAELMIDPSIWYALMRAARTKPTWEVMGVGHACIDADSGTIVMDDIYIPPQEVTGITVETSGQDFMKLWSDLVTRYQEKWTEWCIMWHSHCNMSTSPSTVDIDALATVVENNWPFAVGLVINVEGKATAWAEVRKPFAGSLYCDVYIPDR